MQASVWCLDLAEDVDLKSSHHITGRWWNCLHLLMVSWLCWTILYIVILLPVKGRLF